MVNKKVAKKPKVVKAKKDVTENKKTKTKKHKIDIRMIIVSVVLLVAIIAVSIVLGLYGHEELNDGYFVSDNSKIVMTVSGKNASPIEEESGYEPIKVYTVYYYVGNSITGAKVFYEYINNDEAKVAYEKINLEDKDWAISKGIDNKYIIVQYNKSLLKDFTAEQIRNSVEEINSML